MEVALTRGVYGVKRIAVAALKAGRLVGEHSDGGDPGWWCHSSPNLDKLITNKFKSWYFLPTVVLVATYVQNEPYAATAAAAATHATGTTSTQTSTSWFSRRLRAATYAATAAATAMQATVTGDTVEDDEVAPAGGVE